MTSVQDLYSALTKLIDAPGNLDLGKDSQITSTINYMDSQGYPNFQNYLNDTLVCACFKGKYRLVEYLLLSPLITIHSQYHYKRNYPFRNACMSGNIQLVDFMLNAPRLLEKGIEVADINIEEDGALANAAMFNRLPLVKHLLYSPNLKRNNKLFFENKSALLNSCQFGYIDIATLLLKNENLKTKEKADIDAGRDNVLVAASHNGNTETLDFLLRNYSFNLGINAQTIFKKAFLKTHLNLLHYLIFQCDIEKTSEISQFLEENKNEPGYLDTQNMFDKKDFNRKLNEVLSQKHTLPSKKIKL